MVCVPQCPQGHGANGSSQGQAKGQSEGHLHGNFGHGVMETHVELLRDRLQ